MLFSSGALTTPLLVPLDRITSSASTTPIILLLFIITIPRAAQVSKQNNNNRKSFFLQMSARQERWIIRWVTCSTTGEQMIDSAIVFPCYSTVNQLYPAGKTALILSRTFAKRNMELWLSETQPYGNGKKRWSRKCRISRLIWDFRSQIISALCQL